MLHNQRFQSLLMVWSIVASVIATIVMGLAGYMYLSQQPISSDLLYMSIFWLVLLFICILTVLLFILRKLIVHYFFRPLQELTQALDNNQLVQAETDNEIELVAGLYQLKQGIKQLQNQYQAALTSNQALNDQYTNIMDHVTFGVLLVDAAEQVIMLNQEAKRLLSTNLQAEGMHLKTVVKNYELLRLLEIGLKSNEGISKEIEFYVPNSINVAVKVIPMVQKNQSLGIYMVLMHDLSEIRKLENAQTEFITNASHELRTPVTAIRGFAETLLGGALEDQATSREFIEIIAKETSRLERMYQDILDLARIEKHQELVHIGPCDLVEVIQVVLRRLEVKAHMKQITLSLDGPESLMIESDMYLLERIFTNLVDNAIAYSNHHTHVQVLIESQAKTKLVYVIDQGIGISQAEQARIFERFYRVDKARSRQAGGTGLGLSIVNNLLNSLGAHIEVQSELGKGSIFKVTLPITK